MKSTRIKTKDGFEIYYETYSADPTKPTLFFLHGAGGDLDAWHFVRDEMLARGFPCVAIDLRGHGYSSHPRSFKSYKIENLVQDILEILNKEKLSKIILIGHCYGAIVATEFALAHQDRLEKLILISSSYRAPDLYNSKVVRSFCNVGINLIALFSPKPFKPRHSDYPPRKFHKDYEWTGLARTILHNSLRSYLLTSKEIVNLKLKTRLGAISLPTLIMAGDQDSIFPIHLSKTLNQEILNSNLVVIPGGNHVVVLNNVEPVVQAICKFLK